tara:strand:+ start:10493 stop:11035 length:543 start_codon:yes stop_codon:yes gene_type:complete
MPYARQNWTEDEITRLLENPVDADKGPHAHSKIHAVSGELASNEMFQHARVLNRTTELVNGKFKVRTEATKHSTMASVDIARGLHKVLNHDNTQPLLRELDGKGNDDCAKVTFHVNFNQSIGRGLLHSKQGVTHFDCIHLFVYLKSNSGNSDLPVIHTVVPTGAHQPNPKKPKDDKVLLM